MLTFVYLTDISQENVRQCKQLLIDMRTIPNLLKNIKTFSMVEIQILCILPLGLFGLNLFKIDNLPGQTDRDVSNDIINKTINLIFSCNGR